MPTERLDTRVTHGKAQALSLSLSLSSVVEEVAAPTRRINFHFQIRPPQPTAHSSQNDFLEHLLSIVLACVPAPPRPPGRVSLGSKSFCVMEKLAESAIFMVRGINGAEEETAAAMP